MDDAARELRRPTGRKGLPACPSWPWARDTARRRAEAVVEALSITPCPRAGSSGS